MVGCVLLRALVRSDCRARGASAATRCTKNRLLSHEITVFFATVGLSRLNELERRSTRVINARHRGVLRRLKLHRS